MIKEFKVNDILKAVDTISNLNEKNNKYQEIKKRIVSKEFNLAESDNRKFNKGEVLILDQMID